MNIKHLVKLADSLDKAGLINEANEVDLLIKNAQDQSGQQNVLDQLNTFIDRLDQQTWHSIEELDNLTKALSASPFMNMYSSLVFDPLRKQLMAVRQVALDSKAGIRRAVQNHKSV